MRFLQAWAPRPYAEEVLISSNQNIRCRRHQCPPVENRDEWGSLFIIVLSRSKSKGLPASPHIFFVRDPHIRKERDVWGTRPHWCAAPSTPSPRNRLVTKVTSQRRLRPNPASRAGFDAKSIVWPSAAMYSTPRLQINRPRSFDLQSLPVLFVESVKRRAFSPAIPISTFAKVRLC